LLNFASSKGCLHSDTFHFGLFVLLCFQQGRNDCFRIFDTAVLGYCYFAFSFKTFVIFCSLSFKLFLFVVVPRIQFLAVEVARNKEGCNDAIRDQQIAHCDTATDATV